VLIKDFDGSLTRRVFATSFAKLGMSLAGALLVGSCASRPDPWSAALPRVRRIGYLPYNPSGRGELDPFILGLRDLGYAEGQDYTIESRYAELHPDRTPGLASELVRLQPDIILTEAFPAAMAAKSVTNSVATSGAPSIPVVFVLVTDPVALGLVAGMARPGGNVTGLNTLSPAISTKRMELLHAIAPEVSRVTVLHDPDNPSTLEIFRQTEAAGQALGMEVLTSAVRVPEDVAGALSAVLAQHASAVVVAPATAFQTTDQRTRLLDFAAQHGLITIATDPSAASYGYLLAAGPRYADIFRRAASYVDKIFKGAHPADLPVEQPTTFDIAVNLTTAKALGLAITPEVAAQVTEWAK
jgi:putative ABC transport system substrate-binding protein